MAAVSAVTGGMRSRDKAGLTLYSRMYNPRGDQESCTLATSVHKESDMRLEKKIEMQALVGSIKIICIDFFIIYGKTEPCKMA